MMTLPSELIRVYETLLAQHGGQPPQRPHYLKWMRYCWDFCHKHALAPSDRKNFPVFDERLRTKGQPAARRMR